eukprot:scaffold1380_cov161-Amphora_coffeaeformis.AAC.12
MPLSSMPPPHALSLSLRRLSLPTFDFFYLFHLFHSIPFHSILMNNNNDTDTNDNPWTATGAATAPDPWTRGEAWAPPPPPNNTNNNNNTTAATATTTTTATADNNTNPPTRRRRTTLVNTTTPRMMMMMMNAGNTTPPPLPPPLLANNNINNNNNTTNDIMNTTTDAIVWRERERRQRTVRAFLTFLFLLLLLEDDNNNLNNNNPNYYPPLQQQQQDPRLRRRRNVPPPQRVQQQQQQQQPTTATDPQLWEDDTSHALVLWERRQGQDIALADLWSMDERYVSLTKRNHHRHVDVECQTWAVDQVTTAILLQQQQQSTQNHTAVTTTTTTIDTPTKTSSMSSSSSSSSSNLHVNDNNDKDSEAVAAERVWHYPWNATGLFLGEWVRQPSNNLEDTHNNNNNKHKEQQWLQEFARTRTTHWQPNENDDDEQDDEQDDESQSDNNNNNNLTQPAPMVETTMQQVLRHWHRPAGVYFLPQPIHVRDDHNLTSLQWERTVLDASGRIFTPEQDDRYQNPFWKLQQRQVREERRRRRRRQQQEEQEPNNHEPVEITLQQRSGRIALRLYTRDIPGMQEISIVDGSVKFFDRHSHHYTSPLVDIVVRVRGVLFRRVGHLSLVSASTPVTHSALVLQKPPSSLPKSPPPTTTTTTTTTRSQLPLDAKKNNNKKEKEEARRRLSEVNWDKDTTVDSTITITKAKLDQMRDDIWMVHGDWLQSWVEENHRRLQEEEDDDDDDGPDDDDRQEDGQDDMHRVSASSVTTTRQTKEVSSASNTETELPEYYSSWSDFVIPFPYVMDDADETIRQIRTPASRRLMPQERILELNAAHCQFEMEFDVQPEEWTEIHGYNHFGPKQCQWWPTDRGLTETGGPFAFALLRGPVW